VATTGLFIISGRISVAWWRRRRRHGDVRFRVLERVKMSKIRVSHWFWGFEDK
jgi:hypothetical protein